MADDHVNVAVASDGTLYAAVKTSYDSSGTVTIGLLARRPDGTWDDLYDVADGGETRPIVQLNETTGTVLVAYTGGSSILYEESPVSVIDFGGSGGTLISGGGNNASSMKDNFSDELVVISSDGSNVYGVLCASATPTLVAHYEMEEDGGTTLVDSSTYGNNGTISQRWVWSGFCFGGGAMTPSSESGGRRINAQRLLIVLGLLVISGSPALAGPPPLPSSFYGTVTMDEVSVPVGTTVSAWINGEEYALTSVTLDAGGTVDSLDVPGDDPATSDIEGGVLGDTLVFYIGDRVADQTGSWHSSTNVRLDLAHTSAKELKEKSYLPVVDRHVAGDVDTPLAH